MKSLGNLIAGALCAVLTATTFAQSQAPEPIKQPVAGPTIKIKKITKKPKSRNPAAATSSGAATTAGLGDDNCDPGLTAGTSAARSSVCLPEDDWETWDLDLEFFNPDLSSWVATDVVVTLPPVTVNGPQCQTTIVTSFGSRAVSCGEISVTDLLPIGIPNDSRSGLVEIVAAVQVDDLGKIASIAAGEWRKNIPCVNSGESGSAYAIRAKADCTAHVYDQLPSLGTLGQRQTAAAQACNALSAEIAELYAVGNHQCSG